MIGLLVFAPAYLLGCWAFWAHAWKSAVHVVDDGKPVTAKILPFPVKGEATPSQNSRQNAPGSNRVVRANSNLPRGGN